jgi:hypothetical protein
MKSAKQADFSEVSGVGMWTKTEEGSATEEGELIQGYDSSLVFDEYGKKIGITQIMLDDDKYAIVNFLTKQAQLIKGGFARCNQLVADYLNNGFSTAGADGQYLFSAAHPINSASSDTISNLLAGALSHDNLEAHELIISANHRGEDGLLISEAGVRDLIYPPALRGTVARILNSRARPGTDDNDANRFGPDAGKKGVSLTYNPIEFAYLGAGQGGSNTAHYIRMPNLNMAKFIWREKPSYQSWKEEDPAAIYYKANARMAVGVTNHREFYGSTGL